MSSGDLSVFVGLADEILEAIFMEFVYREDMFAEDIQYDNPSAHGTPFSTRFADFSRAIVPASHRFYRIAIRVLWRCVIVRTAKDLSLIQKQTARPCVLAGSTKLGTLTRRLELHITGPYQSAKVTRVLQGMEQLRILVVRNYHLGLRDGFRAKPAHVFRPLKQRCRTIGRVQLDTCLVRPTRRDVLESLIANVSLNAFRVSRFDPAGLSRRLWTPPSSSSQLTTLSFGSFEPYDHAAINPCIGALLSALTAHFALPNLTTLDLFEPSDKVTPFLEMHGSSLRRLALAPRNQPSDDNDSCLAHCPVLEELEWVMRGWGCLAPPKHGHDCVSKVAIFYVKEKNERKTDCIQQLGDAVNAFGEEVWPGIEELEVIVRGHNVPAFRDCVWDDDLVLDVQTLDSLEGWRAELDVVALTS